MEDPRVGVGLLPGAHMFGVSYFKEIPISLWLMSYIIIIQSVDSYIHTF